MYLCWYRYANILILIQFNETSTYSCLCHLYVHWRQVIPLKDLPWISDFLSGVQPRQCPLCSQGVRTRHFVCLLSDSKAWQTFHMPARCKSTIIITHYCQSKGGTYATGILPHTVTPAWWQTHHIVAHDNSQMRVSKHMNAHMRVRAQQKSHRSWPPRRCHFWQREKKKIKMVESIIVLRLIEKFAATILCGYHCLISHWCIYSLTVPPCDSSVL